LIFYQGSDNGHRHRSDPGPDQLWRLETSLPPPQVVAVIVNINKKARKFFIKENFAFLRLLSFFHVCLKLGTFSQTWHISYTFNFVYTCTDYCQLIGDGGIFLTI
jgi:hypothetical protein